jgi:hypothetical protein
LRRVLREGVQHPTLYDVFSPRSIYQYYPARFRVFLLPLWGCISAIGVAYPSVKVVLIPLDAIMAAPIHRSLESFFDWHVKNQSEVGNEAARGNAVCRPDIILVEAAAGNLIRVSRQKETVTQDDRPVCNGRPDYLLDMLSSRGNEQ